MLFTLLLACPAPSQPTVTGVAPDLFCDGDAGELVVTGADLRPLVEDALTESPSIWLPEVRLTAASTLDGGPIDAAEIAISAERTTWRSAAELVVDVDAGLGLGPGVWDLSVDAPAGVTTLGGAVTVAGAPSIASLAPATVCQTRTDATLQIQGADFIVLDDAAPTATLGGAEAEVLSAEGCAALAGAASGEVCSSLELTLDATSLPLGLNELLITNPDPLSCVSSAPATIQVVSPPEIVAVEPAAICESGGALTISGVGFQEGSTVQIGALSLEATYVDAQTLEVELPELGLEPGLWDVSVDAPDGCGHTLAEALEIWPSPVVYAVEPSTVYGPSPSAARALLADVNAEIEDVWLEDGAGARIDVEWSWSEDASGELTFQTPSGLAAGDYPLRVEQDEGCGGEAAASLQVVDALEVYIEAVEPPFAWSFDYTPVEILGASPPPGDAVGFADTPRAWLAPSDGGAPVPLLGVNYQGEDSLSTVVPAALADGDYDLLVINPDGALGRLERALNVTLESPPEITGITPGTLPNSADQELTIYGRDFRTPSVALECLEDGLVIEIDAPVISDGYAELLVDAPVSSLNRAVCLVRVTNSDGTYARYSALSVTNPAQNLDDWSVGPELVEARRAPAAFAGRATSLERYLYAVGGDAGDASTALDTLEVAPVGVYGDLEDWSMLKRPLPEPRTFAVAAKVNDFVYLIGGHDGASAVDTVWRARTLDPLDVPWIEAVSLSSIDGDGPGAGLWLYSVSALFPADDEVNPDGESLTTPVSYVTLPDDDYRPTLSWQSIEGASGYRIYRSVAVGEQDVAWVADVEETSWTDDGGAVDASLVPLQEGALGAWAEMPSLSTPRASPCVAVAWDPLPDPEIAYVYIAGGQDASGSALDSVELLDVQVVSADNQNVGVWTDAGVVLDTPRYRCGAYTLSEELHTVVDGGESWVYFAGGLTDSGSGKTGEVEVGVVGTGGLLEQWQEVDSMSPARAGFGYATASDFLYAFGGQNGDPGTNGVSSEIDPDAVPELLNWNGLGTSLHEARALPGSAQESAVIFVIGGETDTANATRAVDWTNY